MVTTAEAAEADPAVTTVRAAELKRTASAVAVEMLRVRTVVVTPTRKPGGGPGDEMRRATPGQGRGAAAGGSVWHGYDS
ncbi:hypothetical protein GCM10027074_73260 [Streptomyces deserti]